MASIGAQEAPRIGPEQVRPRPMTEWRRNMKAGFIGLGMMGKGMAANLQKAGHQLTVYDLHRAAAEPFLAKGAEWANSPRAVAEASEVIFTSLPVPADVEAVALGTGGLNECRKP